MEKIKDLMMRSAKGAGIPDKIELPQGSGMRLRFLMSGRLMMPLVIMLTNINHYRAFGKELIHIEGGVIPDVDLPFGCRIEGDIDLNLTAYPIGYILIAITSTFNDLKPYILNGKIDELTLLWKNKVEKASRGKKILGIKDYADLPPLKQMKKM
ncbi:hypothetical protein QTV49_000437 [Vibrio vulnificus]|nr:hypothetical protein [Vibrio vulnificus]